MHKMWQYIHDSIFSQVEFEEGLAHFSVFVLVMKLKSHALFITKPVNKSKQRLLIDHAKTYKQLWMFSIDQSICTSLNW